MRKLLVVLSAIMLVAAFAVPVFADWTGELEFGFATAFDPAKDDEAYGELYTVFSKDVDDYNSVTLEFDGSTNGLGTGNAWTVGEASISTDIGKAAGLPVGLTLKSGFFASGTQEYASVTGWGIEDVAAGGTTLDGGFQLGLGFGSANLDVAFGVADADGQDLLIDFYMPDLSGASVELYYDVVNNDDLKGAFGVDGSYAVGPATVAAGFYYNSVAESWGYGLGVSAGVSMATLGVSLDGNDTDALNTIGIDANLAPADNYGLDVGIMLSMADGADTFQCADISAYYKVGAATIRVGYDVTETGEAYMAPAVLQDNKGGLYADVAIEF